MNHQQLKTISTYKNLKNKLMKKIILFLIVALMTGACSKVPITNRRQMKVVPDSYMVSLSLTSYQEFLGKNPPLPPTNRDVSLVNKVGDKLAKGIDQFMSEIGRKKQLRNFSWEYNVVNNNQVNAWCMPGGKIMFYTGIFPLTKDEFGIATVMGHEMAHAVAKHGNERMSQQLAIALGGVGIAVAMAEKPEETKAIFQNLYGIGAGLGMLAYSRKHEYEADKIGMVFMAKAGYDPAKAIEFWERMSSHGGASIPEFLSTHPNDQNRIEELKKFLPTAKKYYNPY